LKQSAMIFASLMLGSALLIGCGQSQESQTQAPSSDSAQGQAPSSPRASADNSDKEQMFAAKDTLFGIRELLLDSNLLGATVSILIWDDALGQSLVEINPRTVVVPASTQKLLTTAMALEVLGEGRQFATLLQTDGKVTEGVLEGNLYITGGGDPAFLSDRFGGFYGDLMAQWARLIKDKGIDSVAGRVVADARVFDSDASGSTWSWGELAEYYCAPATGLSINENLFQMSLNVSRKGVASPSQVKPAIPGLVIENQANVGNVARPSWFLTGPPYSPRRVLKGGFPAGGAAQTLEGAIPDPPLVVANELHKALLAAGLRLALPPTSVRDLALQTDSLAKAHAKRVELPREELARKNSPSVGALVGTTNMASHNLFAEHLLIHSARQRGGGNSIDAGAAFMQGFWKNAGLDCLGLSVYDGSGISRYNGVSASHLVQVLRWAAPKPWAKTFEGSLPVAGVSGTLRTFCDGTAAAGKIRAKSGSMTRVISYAGYATHASGRKLTFAFLINNYNQEHAQAKELLEKLALRMVTDAYWPQ